MPITHKWNGTILTITSDSGTSSADLKGEKGDDGARGAQGAPGDCVATDTALLGGVAADKYALKTYVDNAVSNVDVDLSAYATQEYVNKAIPSLDGYATKTYVNSAIPSLEGYATQQYVNNAIPSLDGYATQEYVNNAIPSLGDYATKQYAKGMVAHNLLDNSLFEIAQAGYPGQHGSKWFVADRWEAEKQPNAAMYDTHFSFNAADSGEIVVCQKTTDKIAAKLIGKTITLAVCTEANEILCATGTVAYNTPVAQIIYGDDWSVTLHFFHSAGSYQLARFTVNAGKTVNIKWVALYEGSYTAETLPPYIPKGYAAELAECLRYFERKHYHLFGNGTSSMFFSLQYSQKRIYPTISTISTDMKSDNVNVVNEVWNATPTSAGGLLCTVSDNGNTAYWYGNFDISADL